MARSYPEHLRDIKTRTFTADTRAPYQVQKSARLTVVFHSDPVMLGATWALQPEVREIDFGRETAFKSVSGEDCYPLMDAYISRELACLHYVDDVFEVQRNPSSSPIESSFTSGTWDAIKLDANEGMVGALTLSHRVVLALSFGTPLSDTIEQGDSPIVGESLAVRALRAEVQRVAATDDDVLITGPTGVGKESVASEIHRLSARAEKPYIRVNLAAIPEELASAEFFGAEKGAFTGAHTRKRGLFRQANTGSILLDEVGDAAPALQAQLLRVLQEREVQVVGGAIERVDLRVIAATEQDVDSDKTTFRAALKHRLAQQRIRVPPLAARKDDIGLLAFHFLTDREVSPWGGDLGPIELAAWSQIFHEFVCHNWPGNIRELQSVLVQIRMIDGVPMLVEPLLTASPDEAVHDGQASAGTSLVAGSPESPNLQRAKARTSDISSREFCERFDAFDFEVTAMANHLAWSRTSVYRRMDKEGFPRARSISEHAFMEAFHKHGDFKQAARALRVSLPGLIRLHPEWFKQ